MLSSLIMVYVLDFKRSRNKIHGLESFLMKWVGTRQLPGAFLIDTVFILTGAGFDATICTF